MSETNFEKVLDFNRQFGTTVHTTQQPDIFDQDPKLIKLKLSLIQEEVKELEEAVSQKNFKEVIDALSDILYVAYGMFCALGTSGNEAHDFTLQIGVIDNKPNLSMLEEHPNIIDVQLNNIINDMKTLEESVNEKQFTRTNDSLKNIIFDVNEMFYVIGINGDQAFDLVHKSNMTKLCSSEKEAEETVAWYINNEKRYDSPSYRKSYNDKYWVVYNKSTGKILKSINYKPVDFSSILDY